MSDVICSDIAPIKPDIQVSVRDLFGIDSDLCFLLFQNVTIMYRRLTMPTVLILK